MVCTLQTFRSPFQAKSVILKLREHPPHLRVRFSGRLAPGMPNRFSSFSFRPLAGNRRKRLFDDILFCVFFVPWVSPTARNIQPLTRLLRKRNYAASLPPSIFHVRFSSAADTAAIQQVRGVAAFSRFLEASAASVHPLITSRTLRTSREISSGANITNVLVRLRRTA